MVDRKQLISDAFAAFSAGDLQSFGSLFDPAAKWVGVPGGGENGEPHVCSDRSMIAARFRRLHESGRSFELGEMIEQEDRVAVAITIVDPSWSGPVNIFKVFTFRPGEGVVVRMNDCIDESYARQVLAA
jgi:ketosteroid isomerase-like protein